MSNKNKKELSIFLDLLVITFGSLVTAFALNMLIIPAGLLSGGLTGISQFINHFIPINVGVSYLLLNIPLLILGYIHLGKKFSIYTIISTVLLSVSLYFVPVTFIWTDNIILCAIFGGVVSGLGSGIVLRRGGSQGGLDILSRIVAKYKNISVGKVNLLINMGIIVASGFVFGSEIALYTIIAIFSSMKMYEVILNHVNRVSVLVITDKGNAVSDVINQNLHRGTTMWDASGGYTHDAKTVLYCVITNGQLADLKNIVKSVDEKAFVSVISTETVIGRFNQMW